LSVTFASSIAPLGVYVHARGWLCRRVDIKGALLEKAFWPLSACVSAAFHPIVDTHTPVLGKFILVVGWGGKAYFGPRLKIGRFCDKRVQAEFQSRALSAQITRCLMNLPAGLPGN
jgi:hypothetical protein